MELAGYGYEGDISLVPAARLVADENRVEYHRGSLVEWYVNDAQGLEQGFTVTEPPEGDDTAPLALVLNLVGNVVPSLNVRRDSVSLRGPEGQAALEYGGLYSFDATGRSLASRLDVQRDLDGRGSPHRLRILVDDTDAVYPITIDPLISNEVAKLTASDEAAGDLFGRAVALSGDTLVIGAPSDVIPGTSPGAAYIFERNERGADAWGEVAKLVASDGEAADLFGRSVAMDGDTVVVGAPGASAPGSAYVFSRNSGGADAWGEVAKLTPSDGDFGDAFGFSVAASGDTVLVGAPGHNANGQNSGAAYVFRRNAGGADAWGEVAELQASDGQESDIFGAAVAASGDTLVVTASFDANENGTDAGSAYVFERNQGGVDAWGQVVKLLASDGVDFDRFGESVAVEGGTVVVGASGAEEDLPFLSSSGLAYIFERNHGGADAWGEVAKLAASDQATADEFGASVGISGGTVVVAAPYNRNGGNFLLGSVYVFERNRGGADAWSEVDKLNASDGANRDEVGFSVAMEGTTVVAGAPRNDDACVGDEQCDSGSAYVFSRFGSTWDQVQKRTASDGAADDVFGSTVSMSGDTVLVGAPANDDACPLNVLCDSGAAYVFRRNIGGADVWGELIKLVASDEAQEEFFAWSVAIGGGTGIIGAPGDDVNGASSGSAYLISRNQGGTDAWGEVIKLTASDGAEDDRFGESVAVSGDTVVIGAMGQGDGGGGPGAAYVFQRNEGGADAWGEVAKLTASDGAAFDELGTSVAISGDTVVVGAPGDDDSGQRSGSAYIFARHQGGPDSWGQVVKLTASDGTADDEFGTSVAIGGGTVVVGAPFDGDQGSAYVFSRNSGGPDAWGEVAKLQASDGDSGDELGTSLLLAGSRVMAGAPGADGSVGDAGAVYVFERNEGGGDAWGENAKLMAADGEAGENFGQSVGMSGNFVAVGASSDDDNGLSSGSFYVFRLTVPEADLAITKDNGQMTTVTGTTTSYEIEVTNNGPDDVLGAVVTDSFDPVQFDTGNVSWTCAPAGGSGVGTTCPADGAGADLAGGVAVDLEAGDSVLFTVDAPVASSAVGDGLSNTASVAPPAGTVDLNAGNDSATDTDDLEGSCGLTANLVLENEDAEGVEVYEACNTITAGPDFVIGIFDDVVFRAGERIILRDGFVIESGARFVAEIDPSLANTE